MIFAAVDVIPLMMVVKRLADDVAAVVSMTVEVAIFPFTIEVKVFPEKERVFSVDEATRFLRSVVVATPLIVDVRLVPVVSSVFEEMTELVAVTPLVTL